MAAEPSFRRALTGCERVLGPEHPDTLTIVNNLAFLMYSKGDYAAAKPLLRRALAGRERVLGPEHPDTLGSVHNLAAFLYSEGDYPAAEPLYRSAVEGLLKMSRELGRAHPNLLNFVGNYERCLEKLGLKPEEIRGALEAMMHPFGMAPGRANDRPGA
jgi:tetratricopeptide (TPR) repeat protein